MTFDEWWMEYQGAIKWVDEGASHARAAWDYQQTIIDELQYLNNLQQDRIDRLEAGMSADARTVTMAYVVHNDDGSVRAYTDDTGRLCIGTLQEQER